MFRTVYEDVLRSPDVPAEELRELRLDVRGAQRWQDFYANVARLNPKNPSAQARVDLLQDIVNTLGGG